MKFNTKSFWSNPLEASENVKSQPFYKYTIPEFYLHNQGFSDIINKSIIKYAEKDWSILDIGCGTGRGLAELYKLGFHNLTGIEINAKAIELGRDTFPELEYVTMINAPIEDLVKHIALDFDVIYSVGSLMHLPYEYDLVIGLISESAKKLIITAENEKDVTVLNYPRNYRKYFVSDLLNRWVQVEREAGDKYPPISSSTIKRTFVRK